MAWAWLWCLGAYVFPAPATTLRMLAHGHASWLLAATTLTAGLLGRSAGIPPAGRRERLRHTLFPPLLGVGLWGVALLAGSLLRTAAGSVFPATVGLWALAPWLVRRTHFQQDRQTEDGAGFGPSGSSALATALPAFWLLSSAASHGEALRSLASLATAVTTLHLLRVRWPGSGNRQQTLAGTFLLLAVAAVSGPAGLGVTAIAAALALCARLWGLPDAVVFAVWVPWLRMGT